MKPTTIENIKKIYRYIPGKKVLSLLIRSVHAPKNIHKYLRFWGWETISIPGTGKEFKIFNYCSDIESQVFWYGLLSGWEKGELKEWVERVGQASVILDIGANTGIYSVIAKTVNPKALVYSFEPVERIYKKLRRNIDRNSLNIQTEQIALSNKSGEAIIYDSLFENVTSVTVNKNFLEKDSPAVEVKIKTLTLDDYCEHNAISKIDLIKIDVESHEPEVLEGYSKLSLHKPVVLCEVWNSEIGQRLEVYVKKDMYEYFLINESNGTLEKKTDIEVPGNQKYCNYIFIPK